MNLLLSYAATTVKNSDVSVKIIASLAESGPQAVLYTPLM
jgi:hypothetical protein